MKNLVFVAVVSLLSLTLGSARADSPYGFCWAEVEGATVCTPIMPMPSEDAMNLVCASFAESLGSSNSGTVWNPSIETVCVQHTQICSTPPGH